ncbi:bifunctional nicotinamidase/pyrazinamidase [Denitrobaculum tricleocarpae]|uniref:Nicotinamidase n=1 Tax=Denitrobaculum tricleocarpae TaxID=2591009 RepID=A0A545TEV0_9PROT|nr:bifunctional nicotinamidase/pyrazinamidase [Denitrobaculum tricleocarpae]TQV75764.1 bifunctional nicotinamidase/pyrazinamidase [Denitrobaculum tricleocarpae]
MPITPLETDLLLVIDVQYDFCPGGGLAVTDGDAVVPEINRIARDFAHVVITQDWHPAGHSSFASSHDGAAPFSQVTMPYGAQTLWPDHCVQGTRGAELHDELELPQAEMVIRKGYRTEIDSYSAFFENDQKTPTGLAGYLRERGFQRVFCVGLATDFCVRFSAVDARKQGFEATVIESACRAIDLEGSLAAAKSEMTGLGVELMPSW